MKRYILKELTVPQFETNYLYIWVWKLIVIIASGFATPIRIIDVIENIVDRTYLLPAIQRKFVWTVDKVEDFVVRDDFLIYTDENVHDTIVNLQLLDSALNESKLDTPLIDWVQQHHIGLDNQLIPKGVDSDVANYKEFIEKRRSLLKTRLKKIVVFTEK